jgi:uncharacterized membrane protein YphA (DoxX/SURF4 family)
MRNADHRFRSPARPPRLVDSSASVTGRAAAGPAAPGVSPGPRGRARAVAALRWPFTSRLASPIWLGVRIYLGWFWLQMGLVKFRDGWLTTNPLEPMFQAIAAGNTAAPFAAYRSLIQLLLDLGMAPVMSVTFPVLEVAAGLAFLSGVLIVPAAVGATLLNVNLLLSGIAHLSFDGRFIVLQLLLILAWRVAGYIGFEGVLARGLRAAWRAMFPVGGSKTLART